MENTLAKNFRQESMQKKDSDVTEDEVAVPLTKKPRTSEDFYLFCKFILEHENYDLLKKEEVKDNETQSPQSVETQNGLESVGVKEEEKTVFEDATSLQNATNSEDSETSVSSDKANEMKEVQQSRNHSSSRKIPHNGDESKIPLTGSKVGDGQNNESPITVGEEFDSSDEDSYDLVTCFCRKPFAGRPMIECSKCLTWIHLSCAKVKKNHIPEIYICPSCKDKDSPSF